MQSTNKIDGSESDLHLLTTLFVLRRVSGQGVFLYQVFMSETVSSAVNTIRSATHRYIGPAAIS